MPRQTNNVSDISNQDLFLLKKVADKLENITIKIGKKSYGLVGIEAHIITAGETTFIALPSVYAIFDNDILVSPENTKPALKLLKASKKQTNSTAKTEVELPAELAKQLADFARANNARVILDPEGNYKIQKVRGKRV